MRWSIIRLIWLRELRDQLRDRRTLFMVAVVPLLLYPILGFAVLQFALGMADRPCIIGIERSVSGSDGDFPELSSTPPRELMPAYLAWFTLMPGSFSRTVSSATTVLSATADKPQLYHPFLCIRNGQAIQVAGKILPNLGDFTQLGEDRAKSRSICWYFRRSCRRFILNFLILRLPRKPSRTNGSTCSSVRRRVSSPRSRKPRLQDAESQAAYQDPEPGRTGSLSHRQDAARYVAGFLEKGHEKRPPGRTRAAVTF